MRDSGGHSGNSFAETHIPLLMIGCNCESNNDKFYKQIDFASTFSLLNGLPIPAASVGSVIPEMFFNVTPQQTLDNLKLVNQRLMEMIKSDGTDEYKFKFEKAKTFHQMFANDSNNKNAFHQAEVNYLESSQEISDKLAQRSLDVNIFQVLFGLAVNILICFTILIPCDELVKDLKLTLSSFVTFIVVGFIMKLIVINEIFQQTNDVKSFFIMAVMTSLLRIVLGIANTKLERFKWFCLFDHDLLYLLMLGHFFFVISVGGSSFVEEEHQIWYYFCSAMFAFLTFFEFRGRSSARSFITVTAKCLSFLALHLVIRRMNQTGDKWINVPDLGDWLHKDENENYLHAFIVLSLVASTTWILVVHCSKILMYPFILLGSILLGLHHMRSINLR